MPGQFHKICMTVHVLNKAPIDRKFCKKSFRTISDVPFSDAQNISMFFLSGKLSCISGPCAQRCDSMCARLTHESDKTKTTHAVELPLAEPKAKTEAKAKRDKTSMGQHFAPLAQLPPLSFSLSLSFSFRLGVV